MKDPWILWFFSLTKVIDFAGVFAYDTFNTFFNTIEEQNLVRYIVSGMKYETLHHNPLQELK